MTHLLLQEELLILGIILLLELSVKVLFFFCELLGGGP